MSEADKYKSKCARQADELRRLQRETAEQKNRIAILTRDVNKLRDRLRAVEQYDTARIFRERRERVCCIGNNSSSSRQKVTYQRSTMAEISNFLRERLAIDYRA